MKNKDMYQCMRCERELSPEHSRQLSRYYQNYDESAYVPPYCLECQGIRQIVFDHPFAEFRIYKP